MDFFTKRYHPPGTAPGTLAPATGPARAPLTIDVVDYDADRLEERTGVSVAECRASLAQPTTTWINIRGDVEPATLSELGAMLDLHPLALEDVLNTGQRPKVDGFEDQYFVTLSLPVNTNNGLQTEQISLFFGDHFVVSFDQSPLDVFAPVRKRLHGASGNFRRQGADYLLYALLDTVVDAGFPVLEAFGERIENIEQELLDHPDKDTMNEIHRAKRELLLLRRSLWPQRELLSTLMRDELGLIAEATRPYLRDCYDHSVQVIDFIETYRDMAASMLDVYLSSVSHRLNEVMRVLTVIATVFIPPTFVVGVYGMNFDRTASRWNMPELGWPFGYVGVWAIMVAMIVGMLLFFKRRKWF